MDKLDRDGGNKTQSIYRCYSNYALSKLILDNEDLWKRKKLVHLLQQALWQRPRIDILYTDIKLANKTKINQTMVSSTDHYNNISIGRLLSKTEIGNDSQYFNNSFL